MSSALEHAPKPKTIRGARFIAREQPAAVQIAASHHFNNAWTPLAGLAATANRIRNMCLLPDRIRRQMFEGAILISPYVFRTNSGSLAIFAAILLASSFVSNFAGQNPALNE
jgi:hypothetical protein